jgi:hypothetical protein
MHYVLLGVCCHCVLPFVSDTGLLLVVGDAC